MAAMVTCTAKADTPMSHNIPSVIDLSHLKALPPASKWRELKKAADTFASTGRNLFVHYASPILVRRRELLRASGSTKKKYPKTPAQLWPTLDADDTFFWNQAAKVVRLYTIPSRFSYQPSMLYSHFAKYDYDEVRKAEGKHQTAMLRQLANLFDKTGKTLFYYYTVPRLCQQVYPPSKGETVTGQAAGSWRFLAGREKEKWYLASAKLKKILGDGDIAGLEVLQLDGAEPEVFRLHDMAMEAIGGCQAAASGNGPVIE
ncbi:hypothetical protein BDY17DRAFT_326637 [Neohortaea acidophila]|uniref:Uncharacterized protein n=1 Tax=Neohortaea acidophila TaxID=245834 RepID=A0A6A6PL48_9PEZI|nr:uncharacterized protein BDY17DRAFT_326637 [Neohortaea acidophila]KAF2480759.1 hypothetical protein BDY17DRAFT_326637 [Neohortaea acidophila]